MSGMNRKLWVVYDTDDPSGTPLSTFLTFDEAKNFVGNLNKRCLIKYTTLAEEWSRITDEYFMDEY